MHRDGGDKMPHEQHAQTLPQTLAGRCVLGVTLSRTVLVYRDASREIEGSALRRELLERLARCEPDPAGLPRERRSGALALLLLAAEVETALEDAVPAGTGAPAAQRGDAALSCELVREITDGTAEAYWSGVRLDLVRWSAALEALRLPARSRLGRPEGFAYYGLDPSAYAQAAARQAAPSGRVIVIGIRSIGTSLAAMVRAAARERGLLVERLSVRPQGHPWDRSFDFAEPDLARVRGAAGAECWVVDEGPGLSGSTFLSVGEALERAGVPRERITFFTSHGVRESQLRAPDAARRWQRFRTQVASSEPPFDAACDLGAGRWRPHVFSSEAEWPSSWVQLERRKLRQTGSPDLIKFVGLVTYGEGPLARGRALAAAGFCPEVTPLEQGYLLQRWCPGRVFRPGPVSPALVARIVEYLAFRSHACEARPGLGNGFALEEMTRVNIAEALEVDAPVRLPAERCVYADARLLPHEWVETQPDTWLKVDAIDHGDDHLYPGPCDPAWDIAGVMLELRLTQAQRGELLELYRRAARDDVAPRIAPWLVAYAASRVGCLEMASLSADPLERERMRAERAGYLEQLRRELAAWQALERGHGGDHG
jgi:hypothetical protein